MKRINRRWKDILLGAVGMALVSCMVVPTLAYTGTRNEALTYRDIKVELDGTRLTLRDSDGTVVEPFIIDGTTYLPVRAVAEALGLDVTWNGQTGVVALTTGSGTATGGSTSTGDYIGEEKAKTIALNHAGVSESNAVFLQVQRDYDDGRLVYDVEFYAGNREYDYEIDAYSGSILSYDYDAERYTPSQSQSGDYIGEARAKEIALSQSGVSANDATFIKCKLDFDDGRAVYDVEFRKGWTEYSFEIDAVSGAVLERDVDRD